MQQIGWSKIIFTNRTNNINLVKTPFGFFILIRKHYVFLSFVHSWCLQIIIFTLDSTCSILYHYLSEQELMDQQVIIVYEKVHYIYINRKVFKILWKKCANISNDQCERTIFIFEEKACSIIKSVKLAGFLFLQGLTLYDAVSDRNLF